MSRSLSTAVVGALTIWPLVYIPLFFAMVGAGQSGPPPVSFELVFPIHIGTMIVGLVAMVLVLVHVWRNLNLTSEKRILWVVVLLNLGVLAQPVYWYLHMWNAPYTELDEV